MNNLLDPTVILSLAGPPRPPEEILNERFAALERQVLILNERFAALERQVLILNERFAALERQVLEARPPMPKGQK